MKKYAMLCRSLIVHSVLLAQTQQLFTKQCLNTAVDVSPNYLLSPLCHHPLYSTNNTRHQHKQNMCRIVRECLIHFGCNSSDRAELAQIILKYSRYALCTLLLYTLWWNSFNRISVFKYLNVQIDKKWLNVL